MSKKPSCSMGADCIGKESVGSDILSTESTTWDLVFTLLL